MILLVKINDFTREISSKNNYSGVSWLQFLLQRNTGCSKYFLGIFCVSEEKVIMPKIVILFIIQT